MAELRIASVAVSAATFTIDRPYDYLIPDSMFENAKPGMRVIVPFGRGNKRAEAIILSVKTENTEKTLKALESYLDKEPVLSDEQIRLALWMRDRFFCTVYDAIHAMLPSGMWFKDGKKTVSDKTATFVTLNVPPEEALEAATSKRLKAKQQASILELMSAVGSAAIHDVVYFTGCSRPSINALVKQGYLYTEEIEILRKPDYTAREPAEDIVLSDEQRNAFDGLNAMLHEGKPSAALLYGVTGSGKTSVYINLIKEAIKAGKTAIVLVPEIALTPMLVGIFSAHFGGEIAVLHSSLSTGERYDEWKSIRSGKIKVVIGTRSAIFAPLENIGLIIIDEEQENTYKSENTPRYHAREVAKYRCVRANALLILGSATPAVESMYSAETGSYKLFTLTKRYNEKALPKVHIADMREELKNGNGTFISEELYNELLENIKNGEQSILFLNRRGASNQIVCGECGYVFTCPSCSVSMTYHSANHRLMCHYCGHSEPMAEVCPQCGGILKHVGIGTQKIVEELNGLFPDVPVIRMDTDTVSPAHSHEKLLGEFRDKKIPILVGTQMVTKGLDFENVTLVGVILADQSLYVSDYRAYERTFSLITQVVGRSGRGKLSGRAVIQTYTPDNQIIKFASSQDYMAFYQREIETRRLLGIPPFCELIAINVSGLDESQILRGCIKIKTSLENYLADFESLKLLGPAPLSVAKINNRYRYRLTICCENTKRVRDTVSHILREFSKDNMNRGLSVYADVNPSD